MSRARQGLPPDSPADVRPLPARPNLEFERKQARKLLAQLRQGDPAAVVRVQAKHRASTGKSPDEYQLSDAQFTIAREYGFSSWPKLVAYFETLARHEASGSRRRESHDRAEILPRQLMGQHAARLPIAAATLAAFVPRLYGRSAEQVFAAELTEDDVRLAAARMNRHPSWQAMLETPPFQPRDRWRDDSPMRRAFRAIRERDLATLKTILKSTPELLEVRNPAEPWATSILYSAIHSELRSGPGPRTLELSEWLASTDLDLTPSLNWLLLGFMRMRTADVKWLLDHGADPEWVPPNGIPVLEHALYRYWNGEAVDLISARVKRRQALWIAAGVGDVPGVEHYFDTKGRLTEAAWEDRPDFTAMGPLPAPATFGDEDIGILWEAFLIATWNERYPVLDVLLRRGVPIDYAPWGQPLIEWAIFEGRVQLVEYFINRGAKVDERLRAQVEEYYAQRPDDKGRSRILGLCGGRDPEILVREYQERRDRRVMQTEPQVEKAFNLAKLDALYLGLKAVAPENLFVGLMREDGMPVYPIVAAGTDLLKLRAALGERFETSGDPPPDMTADAECTAILMAGRREAEQRKNPYYTTVHMFYALMRQPPQSVLDLVRAAGGDPAKIVPETEKILAGMG